MVQDGLKKGGNLRCGGGKPKDLKGYFLEPTVITDLNDDHELVREEVRLVVTAFLQVFFF